MGGRAVLRQWEVTERCCAGHVCACAHMYVFYGRGMYMFCGCDVFVSYRYVCMRSHVCSTGHGLWVYAYMHMCVLWVCVCVLWVYMHTHMCVFCGCACV